MNKSELITAVAEKAGMRKSECESVIGAFLDTVTSTLKNGTDIRLVGFGTFSVADRKATVGRNPSTGEEIAIPASRVPKFKPGQGLKDAVNLK